MVAITSWNLKAKRKAIFAQYYDCGLVRIGNDLDGRALHHFHDQDSPHKVSYR